MEQNNDFFNPDLYDNYLTEGELQHLLNFTNVTEIQNIALINIGNEKEKFKSGVVMHILVSFNSIKERNQEYEALTESEKSEFESKVKGRILGVQLKKIIDSDQVVYQLEKITSPKITR